MNEEICKLALQFLARVQTTGLQEAQALLAVANAISEHAIGLGDTEEGEEK